MCDTTSEPFSGPFSFLRSMSKLFIERQDFSFPSPAYFPALPHSTPLTLTPSPHLLYTGAMQNYSYRSTRAVPASWMPSPPCPPNKLLFIFESFLVSSPFLWSLSRNCACPLLPPPRSFPLSCLCISCSLSLLHLSPVSYYLFIYLTSSLWWVFPYVFTLFYHNKHCFLNQKKKVLRKRK